MLSEKIKYLRIENNLSQAQLAIKLNVSQTAVAKWERGASEATENNIVKIANFFNVTTDYLLGLENDFGINTHVIPYKKQKHQTQEDVEMQKFWEALNLEYKWKLLGRAAAILEEQQQRYK